jgi:homospermidine synthase
MVFYLTLRDSSGAVIFRPAVHYAYRPCDAAIASLHDLVGRQLKLDEKKSKVLMSDVTSGEDILGVLIGYGRQDSYWFGSRLSVLAARDLSPQSNATSVQVAAGVLGGMAWAMENPRQGVVEPEDMDWRRVLEVAIPYLGEVSGQFSEWHPLSGEPGLFPLTPVSDDPWCFSNVRVDFL